MIFRKKQSSCQFYVTIQPSRLESAAHAAFSLLPQLDSRLWLNSYSSIVKFTKLLCFYQNLYYNKEQMAALEDKQSDL